MMLPLEVLGMVGSLRSKPYSFTGKACAFPRVKPPNFCFASLTASTNAACSLGVYWAARANCRLHTCACVWSPLHLNRLKGCSSNVSLAMISVGFLMYSPSAVLSPVEHWSMLVLTVLALLARIGQGSI